MSRKEKKKSAPRENRRGEEIGDVEFRQIDINDGSE